MSVFQFHGANFFCLIQADTLIQCWHYERAMPGDIIVTGLIKIFNNDIDRVFSNHHNRIADICGDDIWKNRCVGNA